MIYSPLRSAIKLEPIEMRLFYYKSQHGNFGDDLNEWLWEDLLPGRWSSDSKVLFSGIGTIIGNPAPPADKVIIFTSGIGYSPVPPDFASGRYDVRAVRGPITARILGIPQEKAVADGALLLSTLPDYAPLPDDARHGVVFVPHHDALADGSWSQAAALAGVELLDPRGECKSVINRLRSARLVIADSMHAAIVADTLRVPWIPVATSSAISTLKWLDWAMALGVPYEPTQLPAPSLRVSYQNYTNKLIGNHFFVSPPTLDAAMENFHAVMAAKGPIARRGANLAKRVVARIPKTVSGVPFAGAIGRGNGARMVEQTARALDDIGKRNGYLSDQKIFSEKVDHLRTLVRDL